MAADSGLINLQRQLSLQEAKANVPSLTPLYTSTTSMAKKGLDMVSGAIAELKQEQGVLEAGKKRQTEALQTDANGVFKSIYELKETLPNKIVMAIKKEIKSLQEEFELVNTYGENDNTENNDARIRISARLSRIKNEAVNLRANLMKMTDDVKGDGGWDISNIHRDNIDPLRSILKGDLRDMDDNDNIFIDFDKNGKLTFHTKNYSTVVKGGFGTEGFFREESKEGKLRSFNSDQMLKMLPRKNAKYIASSIGEYDRLEKVGKNDAEQIESVYKYSDQTAIDQTNKYIGRIEDKDEFQNAARANVEEGIPALKESLMQRVDIPLHVMNNIFVDENGETIPIGQNLFTMLNQNNDEVLDEKDYKIGNSLTGKNKEAFKTAYLELIDVYTNINNTSFNLDNSLVLLGQHHEAYSKQHYDRGFEEGGGKIPGKIYPPKNVSKEDLTIQPGTYYRVGKGGREMGSDITAAYTPYSKGEDFSSYDDAFSFSKKSGKWTVTGPSDPKKDGSFDGPITTRPQDERELVTLMGFDKQSQRLGFKGVTVAGPDLKKEKERLEQERLENESKTKLQGTEFDNSMFSEKADGVLNTKLKSGLYNNINFTNVPGTFYGNKNKIEVFSGSNKIIINFGLTDKAEQENEMKKLNDFITKYNK